MLNPTAEFLTAVQEICLTEHRYKPEAYLFVMAALHATVGAVPEHPGALSGPRIGAGRHITWQELLQGIRTYGLDQFGPLTQHVFKHWGITTTEDFGRIVFLLVEAHLLKKTEEDSIADFQNVYDFSEAFDPQPLFKLTK